MTGPVPKDFFKDHIRIDKANQRNRTMNDNCDSYWLFASLYNTADLEAISKSFDIEEINIDVKVAVEKHITPSFPSTVKKLMDAKFAWDQAARSKARNINKIRGRYRIALRQAKISIDDLVKIIENVVDPSAFNGYLSVDEPYNISKIARADNPVISSPGPILDHPIFGL